ncbi:MAG: bifunctional metallophosphatase/5'-nucleotidase [Candidatus Lindowbacteria bacterium]|nr:bifunctional metallophosphatase/5'-nucleotidase [Candidatus Lindowbacteria bacterium]
MNAGKLLFVILLLVSLLPVCSTAETESDKVKITILYTAGSKGYFLPFKVHNSKVFTDLTLKVGARYGGYAAIAQYIKETRKEIEDDGGIVVLVDGGNSLVGSSEANHFNGLVSIDFMNHMKYDAITVSNLDFNLGQKVVKNMSKKAKFSFLNANLFEKDSGELPDYLEATTLFERKGLKIGIVGYAQNNIVRWTKASAMKGLRSEVAIPIVQKHVTSLRAKGADLVIALDHTPGLEYRKVASSVQGIDVLIDGAVEWASVYTKSFRLA